MISRLEKAKKVVTYDGQGNPNGFLIELEKKGEFTSSYLTAAYPGCFKGYHLHRVRAANYVCIRGTIKIILYTQAGREEHVLSADRPERLYIPPGVPTGLCNQGTEEAWIVNHPDPYYDPALKDEQVDFTEEECRRGIYLL